MLRVIQLCLLFSFFLVHAVAEEQSEKFNAKDEDTLTQLAAQSPAVIMAVLHIISTMESNINKRLAVYSGQNRAFLAENIKKMNMAFAQIKESLKNLGQAQHHIFSKDIIKKEKTLSTKTILQKFQEIISQADKQTKNHED